MYEKRYKKIGAKILYFRKIRGLTQEQLVETGSYPNSVSLSTLMIIADKLNVHTSELLSDIEE